MIYKVSDARHIISSINPDLRLIHIHNGSRHNIPEQFENIVVLEKTTADAVFEILNKFNIRGQIDNGIFKGVMTSDIACDDTCPILEVELDKKSWNTKWKRAGKYYRIEGHVVYTDTYNEVEDKVPVVIRYTRMADVWSVDFLFKGAKFKQMPIRSSSKRYARLKMIEAGEQSFIEEYLKQSTVTGLYGID